MSKSILVVYYSQSGQLEQIVNNFTLPFVNSDIDVEYCKIKPVNDFPFPWTSEQFFDAMPESVAGIPTELNEPIFKRETYDLIVFAYQPWYLSPSIPANSVLQNQEFKNVLINTPVVTLIGSRNMWLMAQEQIKKYLKDAVAILVGNIALHDRNSNLISAITVQYWMFTGKKDNWLGIFPKPGISDEDILSAKKYGEIVLEHFKNNNLHNLQSELIKNKALQVKSNILFIESRGYMMFKIWARTVLKKRNRKLWIHLFKCYLIFVLFILSPLILLFYILFIKPFLTNKIKKQKEYYLNVN
ncbi:MAG: hypothetical protein A2X08_13370 [Bacteroidetes bacterium GWA2_32_17]|nr:MAG: hypothetical protein A2X08_13370 [Bacteroidetes bacterium GWA2_32_17]